MGVWTYIIAKFEAKKQNKKYISKLPKFNSDKRN